MPGDNRLRHISFLLGAWITILPAAPCAWPQEVSGSTSAVKALADSLRDLQTQVSELRANLQAIRAEALELRRELEATRSRFRTSATPPRSSDPEAVAGESQSPDPRLSELEEEQDLLSAKVDEQYQTKVESGSKYRVRLSGIALLNAFSNRGTVDAIALPSIARPEIESGSAGATVRQSQLGFEVFGPVFGGARTTAEIWVDLAGAQRYRSNVNSELLRLRTATVRMDWTRTSIVAGQDDLFFSPLSPASMASLAVPALWYAGNLWQWTPQVRFEHAMDVSRDSQVRIQAGLLDPLNDYLPEFHVLPQPLSGGRSRQPAYAARIAWSRPVFGRTLVLGAGGYHGRQNWLLRRELDAWVATSDWTLPLGAWIELSGEIYRGHGIGGLGGGFGRSAVFDGPLSNPATLVRGINDTGGWAQLKIKPAESLEINGAFGQDASFARDVRRFTSGESGYSDSSVVRNSSSLANIIYRPRSNLLFSLEYRRIRTLSIGGEDERAGHINLAIGVLY